MKLKFFFLLVLTLFIVNSSLLIATVRYVSKTGTNTPPYTSWETAATSIQLCINVCVDGDTIYVANGVYKENLVINTAINLIGSSMDSTVIDGTGLGVKTIILNKGCDFRNFNILGKDSADGYLIWGLTQDFSEVEIKYCNLSNGLLGVGCWGINASNLFMTNLNSGINTAGQPNSYNEISNCYIIVDQDLSQGIAVVGPNDAYYNIIGNIILFSGEDYLNPWEGISIDAPRKVYIFNNLISGFSNNIFISTPTDTVFIKNNTLMFTETTTTPPGVASINTYRKTLINNIIILNNTVGIKGSSFVESNYNLFWNNDFNQIGSANGDSNLVADPMFVKDTIPLLNGNYDFHLQKYSPAIDKGDPNILDLDGTRSDIGMYGGPFGETYTYMDLAPLAPRNLSAFVDSNYITVRWNRNTEADTSFYKVYRDTISGFQIDSTKLVSSLVDTFFVQPNPHINTRLVYKITCVDNQGNESKPSEELVVTITPVSMDDYPVTISDYVLYQNYPNPFNPITKIGYQLKERAYVKLMVYDIKGELVSVLVNKEQIAGYYEAEFSVAQDSSPEKPVSLASGIYLYRIEIIGEAKIPVYTEMKKMILIK